MRTHNIPLRLDGSDIKCPGPEHNILGLHAYKNEMGKHCALWPGMAKWDGRRAMVHRKEIKKAIPGWRHTMDHAAILLCGNGWRQTQAR